MGRLAPFTLTVKKKFKNLYPIFIKMVLQVHLMGGKLDGDQRPMKASLGKAVQW